MSTRDGDSMEESADPVETLLELAVTRPVPPQVEAERVRAAVHGDWQTVVRAKRARVRFRTLAAAATVLLSIAVFILFQGGMTPVPAELARVEVRQGPVHFVGPDAALMALSDDALRTGQVIQTGAKGGVGLRWQNAASLRIDENTRIRFDGVETVYLEHGRLYFDSEAYGSGVDLRVETGQGAVWHVGTRYMAEVRDDRLVVSVRSGKVRIDGRYFDAEATAGRQVILQGRSQPAKASLPGYGSAWAWTEALGSRADVDGRSLREFLGWVAAETGYRIIYANEDANRIADTTTLLGAIEADPLTELRLRLMTTDLGYVIDRNRGEIMISTTERGTRN